MQALSLSLSLLSYVNWRKRKVKVEQNRSEEQKHQSGLAREIELNRLAQIIDELSRLFDAKLHSCKVVVKDHLKR